MIYVATLAVYSYLFWSMSRLPYLAYIKALCAYDEIEEERDYYFTVNRKNDPRLDDLSDKLLNEIIDPGVFLVKKMLVPFFHCVLFSLFALWVFFQLDVITLEGVRIIASVILASCLFVLSIHLSLIYQYKKQAKKLIEEKMVNKRLTEEAELQSFLSRTSADYDTTETE